MSRRIATVVAMAMVVTGLGAVNAPEAGAAEVACGSFSSGDGVCINTQLTVGGTSYNVDWYVPDQPADALMLLQHGFARGCGNLRDTSKQIMESGVMVLCLNANMQGGNPTLGNALGDLLASRALAPPGGAALPQNYIVGGHSAGGHFASVVGSRLDSVGYPDLEGAILFDPVADSGFTANVQAISDGGTRKVLSVAARPALINLFNNSFDALEGLPNGFVGIQLVWSGYFFGFPYGGSCHTDVEGNNGDIVGNIAAGCTPSSFNVNKLREFASVWASDMATGSTTSAYWCSDQYNTNTCGSKVRSLVTGWLPKAALIR